MKKVFFILACIFAFASVNVYADEAETNIEAYDITEETVDVSNEALDEFSDDALTELTVSVNIGENGNLYPKNFVLGVYSSREQFWGAGHAYVAEENCVKEITFKTPEFKKGDTLYLSVFSGAEQVEYGQTAYKLGDMIKINTSEPVELTVTPLRATFVKAYANEWELYFENPAKIIDGSTMIPLDEYLTAMSMMHCKTEDGDRTEISADGHKVEFYLGGSDMYADGKVTYSDAVPVKINGELYVPVRFLVEGLGGKIIVENKDGVLNVTADYHFSGLKKSEYFVRNIKSRTNYLIWVSRKDFKVTVFENKNEIWAEQKVFPCSVGAVSTPTITGEFDYFSKEKRWSYPTYYVGPIMRFYSGYALHSTLLRYDGSDADGRLGKRISHGCVRLRPADINWMAETIPLYSKVYVTE